MADEMTKAGTTALANLGEFGIVVDRPETAKKGDMTGRETIGRDDIQMPRLALSQALSPQLTEGNEKLIPGLKVGELFNDLTGEIYGKGPLYFAIIRRDRARGVQFAPIEEGGGVIDPDVPLDDPRMQFTTVDGKRVKPVATKFYDFIIVLLGGNNVKPMTPIALSFKGGGLKVAKQLAGLIQMRDAALFKGIYEVHVEIKQQPKPHYVYVVKNAGWAGPQIEGQLEEMFNVFKDKPLDISREPGADDDIPFDVPGQPSTTAPGGQKM